MATRGEHDSVRRGRHGMMQGLQRGFAALALVALPGGVLPVRDTDGKVPDLEITVVGIKDPGKPREVTIRVTNVGPAWADHTTATVQAEPTSAGGKREEDVLDLSPIGQEEEQDTPSRYEFVYTLAAPCGGQEVKLRVSLSAGKDWEGDAEKNLANNAIPRPGQDGVVCPGPANTQGNVVPSQTDSGVLKPAGSTPSKRAIFEGAMESQKPEHQRSGLHGAGGPWPPLALGPSAASIAVKQTRSGPCAPFGATPDRLLVGWYQSEDTCWIPLPFSNADAQVAQTAVNFDLRQLDEVPTKTIKSAVLTFKETPSQWTSGGGGFEEKGGCVQVLGRATAPWEGRNLGTLFPNEKVQGHTPGVTEWFVTDEVRQWVENLRPRHGFVLRGGNENPRGDDNTSCMSEIGEITLTLSYEVP
jgi:hypothetical protein